MFNWDGDCWVRFEGVVMFNDVMVEMLISMLVMVGENIFVIVWWDDEDVCVLGGMVFVFWDGGCGVERMLSL